MDLKALAAKQAELIQQAKDISAKAKAEKREVTEDELAQVDALLAESNGLKAKITHAERALQMEANLEAASNQLTQSSGRRAAPDSMALAVVSKVEKAVSEGLNERAKESPTFGYPAMGRGGLGVFASDVHNFGTGQGCSERLKVAAAAGTGLEAGIESYGGIMLPPAFSGNIMDRVAAKSNNLLNMTDDLGNLPLGVESMEYPATAETSRADGSRAGGIQGYWKAELTQMAESRPKLKAVKFMPQQLYILAYISDKLLKYGSMLEGYLSAKAADEINFKTGDAIINGTGAGMPRGILTGATDKPRVQVAKDTNQPAKTISIQNLQKMYARMNAAFLQDAVWFINQDVYPALLDLSKNVGTGGLPVFLPGGNIANAPFGTIFGRPIVPIEYCATLGTEGDIIFASLKQYATMGRGGVDAAQSIHLKFDFAQTAFRFIFEIDGQPWQDSSITPYKGTNTQSPFVTLATRA